MKSRSFVIGLGLVLGMALAVMFSSGSDEGISPLMIAAKNGDATNLELIISEDVNLDNRSTYGWTALMFASRQGHEDVVRLLMESGADPDLVSENVPARFSTTAGYPETSAISEAISNQHYSIARYLLDQGVFVSPSALAIAGAFGTPDLLKRMVNSGARVNTVSDNQFYQTPLSAAARHGKLENMNWLLANGSDPNNPLPHSSNLNQAIRGLRAQAVAVLLEAGADVDALIGSRQSTALREAIYTYASGQHDQKVQIVEILLKYGADPRYRPDEFSRTMIEQIESNIEASLEGSRDLEKSPETRERYRRSLEADRTILGLLKSY